MLHLISPNTGNLETRQAIWEKQYWRSSDGGKSQELNFNDVTKICRRLNLDLPRDEVKKRFDAADERHKGTLDFPEFRRFVKTLNTRPELELIFDEITKGEGGKLTFPSFLEFMRNTQKVCLLCGSIVLDLLLMILAIPRLRNPRKTSSSCSSMSLQRPSRSPRPQNLPPPNLPSTSPRDPSVCHLGEWRVEGRRFYLFSLLSGELRFR